MGKQRNFSSTRSSGSTGQVGWWSHPPWLEQAPLPGYHCGNRIKLMAGKVINIQELSGGFGGLLPSSELIALSTGTGAHTGSPSLISSTEQQTTGQGLKELKPEGRVPESLSSPPLVQSSVHYLFPTLSGVFEGYPDGWT
jgi:hypothetical protein